MSARTYDAIIFDLFGTLVDSTPAEEIQELFGAMAAELAVAPEDFLRLWMHDTRHARSTGGFATRVGWHLTAFATWEAGSPTTSGGASR